MTNRKTKNGYGRRAPLGRPNLLQVRMSDEEMEYVANRAGEAGLTVAAWVRGVVTAPLSSEVKSDCQTCPKSHWSQPPDDSDGPLSL